MLIFLVQSAVSLPKLVIGILAIRVAREGGIAPQSQRMTWFVVGAAFSLSAIDGLAQSAAGGWALLAGPGTPVFEQYLRLAPAANHSRTFLGIGMGLLLTLLAGFRSAGGVGRGAVLALLGLSMIAGAAVGFHEGPLSASRHAEAAARFDMIETWAILLALLLSLLSYSLDRVLWFALFIHAVRQSWNALWSSAFAWADVPGAWVPSAVGTHMIAIGAWSLMAALAYHRLRLARRGIPVPALLELTRARDASMMGWK